MSGVIGVLVGNLGTPKSPEVKDVKEYLSEFLMDKYVIDKPAWFRWLLVNWIITPFRSKKSAHLYKSVWTDKGSPLLVYSTSVVAALSEKLGSNYRVALGMRYSEPRIVSAMEDLKNCEKIILFPQYPQYADSSYTTWLEEALRCADQLGVRKKIKIITPFYAHTLYLSALEKSIKKQLVGLDVDHLLFSFHGLPVSHLTRLDKTGSHCSKKINCCESIVEANANCYRAQSFYVANTLSSRLGYKDKTSVSFQSRLGREPWIQPYTDVELEKMPSRGIKNLAVVMPAFTVDCLETLEEIHVAGADIFKTAGGKGFYPLYCLNDEQQWIEALAQMVKSAE